MVQRLCPFLWVFNYTAKADVLACSPPKNLHIASSIIGDDAMWRQKDDWFKGLLE